MNTQASTNLTAVMNKMYEPSQVTFCDVSENDKNNSCNRQKVK